jgi:hypothetical protein
MIRKIFWKAFYKITLGESYSLSCKSAKNIWGSINETTKGNLSSFYNVNGEQIRGWHRTTAGSRKKKVSNDLMDRYINEYR